MAIGGLVVAIVGLKMEMKSTEESQRNYADLLEDYGTLNLKLKEMELVLSQVNPTMVAQQVTMIQNNATKLEKDFENLQQRADKVNETVLVASCIYNKVDDLEQYANNSTEIMDEMDFGAVIVNSCLDFPQTISSNPKQLLTYGWGPSVRLTSSYSNYSALFSPMLDSRSPREWPPSWNVPSPQAGLSLSRIYQSSGAGAGTSDYPEVFRGVSCFSDYQFHVYTYPAGFVYILPGYNIDIGAGSARFTSPRHGRAVIAATFQSMAAPSDPKIFIKVFKESRSGGVQTVIGSSLLKKDNPIFSIQSEVGMQKGDLIFFSGLL